MYTTWKSLQSNLGNKADLPETNNNVMEHLVDFMPFPQEEVRSVTMKAPDKY